MITATTDPITLCKATDFAIAPYVIEGTGPHALKIYRNNGASKQGYLSSPLHTPDNALFGGYVKPSDSQSPRDELIASRHRD